MLRCFARLGSFYAQVRFTVDNKFRRVSGLVAPPSWGRSSLEPLGLRSWKIWASGERAINWIQPGGQVAAGRWSDGCDWLVAVMV